MYKLLLQILDFHWLLQELLSADSNLWDNKRKSFL